MRLVLSLWPSFSCSTAFLDIRRMRTKSGPGIIAALTKCFKMWWPGTELNRRRQPFQGCALPPELPGHAFALWSAALLVMWDAPMLGRRRPKRGQSRH